MVKEKNNIYVSDYNFIEWVEEFSNVLRLDKSELTILSYLSALDNFFNFLNVKTQEDIEKISVSKCREYQSYLQKNEISNNSINSYVSFLKVFFNWLVEDEKLQTSPFDKVKKLKSEKIDRAYMTTEEVEQFFKACKTNEEYAMFGIYIYCGLRRTELINLTLDELDGHTFIFEGKGDKERKAYLPEKVQDSLNKYLKETKELHKEHPWVFISSWGKKYSPEGIRKKFYKILDRANFSEKRRSELHLHSTRHTFTAQILGNGNNMKVAQEALGHSNINTTQQIYAHLEDKHVENAMRNVKVAFGYGD